MTQNTSSRGPSAEIKAQLDDDSSITSHEFGWRDRLRLVSRIGKWVEMMILCDYVISVSGDGAIREGVVIWVLANHMELKVRADQDQIACGHINQLHQMLKFCPSCDPCRCRNDLFILRQNPIRYGPMQPACHDGIQDREIAMPWHAALNERVGVDADDHADVWRARYLRTRSGTSSSLPASCSAVAFC